MKFIDPKNEGKFLYIDIVKKILKWSIHNFIHTRNIVNKPVSIALPNKLKYWQSL
jgi:hypothetical protein